MKLRTKTGSASYDRTAIKRRLLVETLCDRRVLAALHGVVFDDVDHSWRLESGETALAQRLVFIDENNNGLPDDGERYFLTDAEGGFVFDELGGDEQIVRLLSRASSQVQHFPIAIDSLVDNTVIDLTHSDLFGTARGLELFGGSTAILGADKGLIRLELDTLDSTDFDFQSRPTGGAMLPGGRLLVLANDAHGNFAFTLLGETVEPIDLLNPPLGELDEPEAVSGWASVAVDGSGDGVLVPQSTSDLAVKLRQLAVGETITSSATSVTVAAGTTAIGGGTATTLIAQPTGGGLELSLWSNSTATLISPESVTIDGAASILGYSDDSGLVFAWIPGGDGESSAIKVLDADANFATLQTIGELDDLVAVDTLRSVIFSLSNSSPVLRAIDAITSETISRWELASAFDKPSEIAIAPGGDELMILVAGGIATIALNRDDAHRIRTDGSTPIYPLRFAVRVAGDNVPPRYQSVPRLVATQGTPLILGEGTLKQGAVDDDEDPFVVVRASSPVGGTVRITPGGAVSYTAHPGFIGSDSFQVFLHDGRGASELATIEIDVLPPVEPPPEVIVDVNPVPENAPPGFVAATIQTIGMGTRPLVFVVDDPRFEIVDNRIVVAQGAVLDYEDTPVIIATLTVSDSEIGSELTATVFTITLSDENDPITDIRPREGSVSENDPGATIAVLSVIDQDVDEEYTFEVSDDRFEIVSSTLRLKDGISLDYEVEPEIVLNIVAADTRGGEPFSIEFIVTVLDVNEPIVSIALSNDSVVEYARGAVVGAVIINGHSADHRHLISIDDSRFEIIDGVLKLRDGVFLIRADQQEAQVVITAHDAELEFDSLSETFLISVESNSNPFHNSENPFDVNGDDEVTPLDALLVLNAISQNGGGGPIEDFPPPGRFWDVNGDGMITPLDALLILNYLNVQNRPRPVGEPEGESAAASQSDDSPEDGGSPEYGGTGDTVGPLSPFAPADETDGNEFDGMTAFGPAQADVMARGRRSAGDQSRHRQSLSDRFVSLIPERFREFDVRGFITNDKIDLTVFRDRLIELLRPSDWERLQRLETMIRRTPIDQTTIEAIDRALLAINAGWDGDE